LPLKLGNDISTTLTSQSIELIKQGKIELKIKLHGDENYNYYGKRTLTKKIHPNGIYELAVSYIEEPSDD
jgi:hypothetical protein